jgi:four helix bundle protein
MVSGEMADKNVIRHFSDLIAWQEAKRLVIGIYKETKSFPVGEQFGLVSQMRRAAVSIPANIAEGFARHTSKDKRSFYQTALASLSELESHAEIAHELDFLTRPSLLKVQTQSERVGKLLTGLLRSAIDRS